MNTLGRKLKIIEFYSYKKLIPLMTLSSIAMTFLTVNYFLTWNHKFAQRHYSIFELFKNQS